MFEQDLQHILDVTGIKTEAALQGMLANHNTFHVSEFFSSMLFLEMSLLKDEINTIIWSSTTTINDRPSEVSGSVIVFIPAESQSIFLL